MSAAPILSLRAAGKSFGSRRVAQRISFDVDAGEVVCLLGPSGSGKSTVLRIVAGVERADEGEVLIAGRVVEGSGAYVPPELRQVGLVFQDLALFPHLNARANAMFGLFRRPKADAGARADALLAMVGLSGHASSFPYQLSGGEQQRLAVARAIAPSPKVMLLDEPFSGLDDRLRDEVRDEVLRLLRAQGAATLFVTHDPNEALRSADRIVLLRDGLIAQAGSPDSLWGQPADLGVASFFSPVSTLEATVADGEAITVLGGVNAPGIAAGEKVIVALRPRDLALSSGGLPLEPQAVSLGSDGLHVRFAPAPGLPDGLSAIFEPESAFRAGSTVRIGLRPGKGFVFRRQGA
jgi:iron(III) transport system ATP-binding protein